MTRTLVLALLLSGILNQSCDEVQVDCTEEFILVAIKVNGEELTDYFTMREATSDTIRYINNSGLSVEHYIVLTDTYQPNFPDSQEDFRFIGILDSAVVVDEVFVIEADQCHINLVSGNTEVTL